MKSMPEKRFSEQTAANYILQTADALQYLHCKHILHRDLKPENLLECNGQIKIADLGWSVHAKNQRHTICGTLDYLPPEMLLKQDYQVNVDIWTLGVLAYELCHGSPPFETDDQSKTKHLIKKIQY